MVSLLMALTGYRKRKYKTRKSMIMGADAPWCEFGQFKRSSTAGGFKYCVYMCRRIKDGSSAATQATTGSSSDAETEAGPSQQQERPSPCPNTLHRSSASVLSPTPTVPGPRPTGYRWSGALRSPPIRLLPARDSRRLERAVGSRCTSLAWPADFTWLHCKEDPDLRTASESEDELICGGCTHDGTRPAARCHPVALYYAGHIAYGALRAELESST